MKSIPRMIDSTLELSVVIVNWNSYKLTFDAIQSLYNKNPKLRLEIIVFDNNSSNKDGLDKILYDFNAVKIIENNENIGFSRGNNEAFKLLGNNHVLVLNPDTLQVDDSVTQATEYLDDHPEIGVLGIKHIDHLKNETQFSAFLEISPWSYVFNLIGMPFLIKKSEVVNHDIEQDVDWITGSFMLIRKGVIQECGGFDERIFLNNEDIEWCRRIRSFGWKIRYIPNLQFRHIGGGTRHFMSDSTYSFKRSRLEFMFRSGFYLPSLFYYLFSCWFLFCAMIRDSILFLFGRTDKSLVTLKSKRFINFFLLRPIKAGID